MTKLKVTLVVGVVAIGVIASLLVQRRALAKLDENAGLLRQYEVQVAELAAENQRLSNLVVQGRTSRAATPENRAAELAQLRAKAEALRRKTHQLARQLTENRRLAGVQFFLNSDFNLLEHNHESTITFAGGPRATGKLNDARAITAALRKYANEHEGEFPANLDQVTRYLPEPLKANSPLWANAPLSGTNDFEIVYQGSRNDLSNIPPRRVALIRERQPWLTPEGKWARVYGYADGAASPVESDDNFQSWDARHIIPPSDTRK